MSIHSLKIAILLITMPIMAHGAIVFDSTGTTTSSGGHTSVTWTHTCNSCDLISVGSYLNGATVTSITYNSVSLTEATSTINNSGSVSLTEATSTINNSGEASQWYLKGPTNGANTVQVNFSVADNGGKFGSISFIGVDQSNPLDATKTSTGFDSQPDLFITTVNDGAWVVDVVGENTGGLTSLSVAGSQTLRYRANFTTGIGGGSSLGPVSPPASTEMPWSLSHTEQWAQAAQSFKPANVTTQYDPLLLLMQGAD